MSSNSISGSGGIIHFSGLASGLPVDDIINQLIAVEHRPIDLLMQRKSDVQNQQAHYTAVRSKVNTLLSSLQTITDSTLGGDLDIFGKKKGTSSSDTALGATVTNSAVEGSYRINIQNLATSTTASSSTGVASVTTTASNVKNIANGAVTSGDFTVYVNGQARTISVDTSVDTVNDVLGRVTQEIQNVSGVAASATTLADGSIQFTYDNAATVSFGATGDTSNFAKLTYLTNGTVAPGAPNNTITATHGTNLVDQAGTLTDNAVGFITGVTAGTFTVGKATFTIDNTTTLTGLIGQINSNADAGAIAQWDSINNKLRITSKATGAQAITLADGTSNFLEATNLVTGGGDSLSSQTLGTNAKFTIDGGTTLESLSNQVDSTVSGLDGVTLDLKAPTGGSPVTLSVGKDTDAITKPVSDFIDALNDVIGTIDKETDAKNGTLSGEFSLTSLRNQLRNDTVDAVGFNTTLKALFQLGISTGAVSTSDNPTASSVFKFDQNKFVAALQSNPSEVKALLVGNGVSNGVLTNLKDIVKSSLDPEFGLFSARDTSANSEIKSINDSINQKQDLLDKKEQQLRSQFASMEQLVQQLQQQQSSISSFAGGAKK